MTDLFGSEMLLPPFFVPTELLLRVVGGSDTAVAITPADYGKNGHVTWGFAAECPIMVIMYSRNEKRPSTWAFGAFRPVGAGTCELLLRYPPEPGDYTAAE